VFCLDLGLCGLPLEWTDQCLESHDYRANLAEQYIPRCHCLSYSPPPGPDMFSDRSLAEAFKSLTLSKCYPPR